MMVLFGFIFVSGVLALILVQLLGIECVNPARPRKVAKASAKVDYPAASARTLRA